MVYKKYVKKAGKTFGPYYYESYRDDNGDVKTRFISGPTKLDSILGTIKNKKRFFKNVGTILIFTGFCSAIYLGAFFILL